LDPCDLPFCVTDSTYLSIQQVFKKDATEVEAGQNVGVIARNIKKDMISRGMVLAAAKSAKICNR